MDLRFPVLLLQFDHSRLDQAHRCPDHKSEHKVRYQCDPAFEVQKITCIIPHRFAHSRIDDITRNKFSGRSHNRTDYEHRYRLAHLKQPEYSQYDQKSYTVYRKPRAEQKSAVDESSAMIYHATPHRLIYPSQHTVQQEVFHIVSERIPNLRSIHCNTHTRSVPALPYPIHNPRGIPY